MTRILLTEQEQQKFFNTLKEESGLNSKQLGKLVGISSRSYRDWQSGKTLPKKTGLKFLSKKFSVPYPKILEES